MAPIEFHNRYTGAIEVERIYGESYLRWVYESPLGRLTLRCFIKRIWFSKWYGWKMSQPKSRDKIVPFIHTYQLNADEFQLAPDQFQSFNAFFSRQLKPEARPVMESSTIAVFPADGRHLGIQDLSKVNAVYAKGQRFDLPTLLRDESLAHRYQGGSAVLSRLCPVDYHRFHFPVSGVAGPSSLVSGSLSSVNPIALRQRLEILSENKRTLTRIRSDSFGDVLMLEIGATCVGSIQQSYSHDHPVAKGSEKGYFQFGGSMTIVLFEPNRIRLDEDLTRHTRNGLELYARMGDSMGRVPT